MDLGTWLQSLGLAQYEAAFRENAVNEAILPKLTAEDLKDIGVTAVGHRRVLLDAIAALRGETAPKQENAPSAAAGPADKPSRGGAGLPEAERRQLTVLFCDLAGSTALSTRLDPEDLREVIGAYHRLVAETVGRVGGFVAKYLGDGIVVYFGYPQAHEDDAERAVRAGLDVVAAVAAFKPLAVASLSCRVGIATGLVVVGDLLGTGAAQEQAVVGETPNVAARLQSLAEAETVVVDTRTRQLVGDLFECHFLGAVEIKGFSEPQRTWRAVGQSRVLSRFEALRSGKTPLVGREEEIALLNRRWQQAKDGEGRVVLLSGEPGIGKSRLTAGLIEDLVGEPHARLRYFCSPQHTDSALYPFVGQLERAAGFEPDEARSSEFDKLDALLSLVSTPVEDRSLIAELLGLSLENRQYPALDLTPQIRKQRTLEALAWRLEVLARQQPVLVIFEDVHWIDPTSLELLDYTVDRIRALPVLLLITSRPDFIAPWIGQPHVTALGLSRLDARASTALAGHVTGKRVLHPVLIAEIVDRADGIPLFLEELTRTVVEADESAAGDVVTAVPPSAVAIPATLYASLAARLDRLGPAKEIAQIAAVIGREFPYELLRELTDLPETRFAPALERLVASELVFRRGTPPAATYAFKHALVQEVAHGTLLRGKRQTLHARTADLLARGLETAERQPEVLAQHYAEAGLSEKAADYWTRAGKRSTARSAIAEAEAQFEKALAQLAKLPESDARRYKELELQTSLGSAKLAIRGFAAPEAGLSYERAREVWGQLGYPSEFLRVAWGQWAFVVNRGELELAHRYADELLRRSDDRGDTQGRILGHLCLGATQLICGEFGPSRLNLESILHLYRVDQRQLFVDHTGLDPFVMALAFLGLVLICTGYVDQGLSRGSEAVEKAQGVLPRTSLAVSLALRTRVAAFLGEDRLFADSAQELHALTIEQGFPFWRTQSLIYRGWANIRQGELEDGLSLLREGSAAYRATGAEVWTPFHSALEAEAEALRGHADVASGILDEALRKSRTRGENWFEAELVRRRGLLFRDQDPPAAEMLFLEAIHIARGQQAKLWELRGASSLARLWAEAGRSADAAALLAPIHASWTEGFDIPDLKEVRQLLKVLGA